MRYLSLFSGIGGFELGIQQAYERLLDNQSQNAQLQTESNISSDNGDKLQRTTMCIGYSEIDKYAIQTYQSHFPEHHNYGDITKINTDELPYFDLIVGGFPCQAFSIAGKRKGFEDTRGTLFFEIARILRAKQPRLFLLENVKGLLSHDNGQTFATIIATLDELGYDLQWQVLNSKDFGVPQNRERVYIVGHLRGTPRPEVFPIESDNGETSNEVTHKGQLVDLTRREPTNYRERKDDGISPTLNTMQGGNRQPFIAEQIRSRVAQTRPNEKDIGITFHKNGDVRPHRLDKAKSGISELAINFEANISNTVTSSHEPKIYTADNPRIRRLTPTECERLQGFPDGWTEGVSDTQRYKTLGNAVTVNVIRDIMEKLLDNEK